MSNRLAFVALCVLAVFSMAWRQQWPAGTVPFSDMEYCKPLSVDGDAPERGIGWDSVSSC